MLIFVVLFSLFLIAPATGNAALEFKIERKHLTGLSPALQEEIAGLQYQLNAYQLKQFFSLADDAARRQWIERYWAAKDPTPTTPVNEMRNEHDLRVLVARDQFKIKQWPGWDKRGEVYIRYGPPGVRAKIHAEVTVRRVHAPGELWYYNRHRMLIVFRDESLTGNYIYAVNALGAAQDITPELAEFLLYDTDKPLSSLVSDEALEFYRDPEYDPDSANPNWDMTREVLIGEMEIRYVRPRMQGVTERWDEDLGNNPISEKVFPPGGPQDLFHKDKAGELAANFEATLEDTPVAYPFNFDDDPLTYAFDVEQFKGGEGVNRIEVNFEIPIEATTPDEAGATREYLAAVVLLDDDYNEVGRDQRKLVFPVTAEGGETRLWPGQMVVSRPPDYYRLAVTITELRAMLVEHPDSARAVRARRRTASYRTNVSGREFDGDLVISDILFAQRIAPLKDTSPFARGSVEVVPHPVRRYRRGQNLPIYFEVYNLGVDGDGLSSFEVEYRIVPHSDEKKHFWDRFGNDPLAAGSRFKSSGYGGDEPVYVTVETGNIEKGTYDFLISIRDELTQSVAYRRATFRIVE